ncbi:S-methyl-5-thioribose-1-phosphate isomerase [Candidatus Micrarchaeota archaeon]|nr:S-methyl-5-thioribose-1-phosphate isomerase [Candidatus Micrarchaeota archaeon]
MDREITQVVQNIKSLKIQGARNVAKSAISALVISSKNSKAKSTTKFYSELKKVAEVLSNSRPTEPMMRNMIDEVCTFALAQINSKKSVQELKKTLLSHEDRILEKMEKEAKHLASYGAKLIPDDAIVLTHCHSSTVARILKEAKRIGKNPTVVCFETRPLFQGRTTAAELAAAGIDTTLSVDGGMNLFMKKADIVLVGADSVTSRGDLINKIGTSTLAHIAKMNDVSFYSAAELFKYSPMTMFGTRERIEERDPKEVWDRVPKKVKVSNPAFEAVAAKYINGYITEVGVIPPQSFFALASEKLGIKIHE